jgi:hypothetical protein
MIHNHIDNIEADLRGRHYGVSSNETWILVQLDDGVEQVRIQLSPDQARHMATLLQYHANKVQPITPIAVQA